MDRLVAQPVDRLTIVIGLAPPTLRGPQLAAPGLAAADRVRFPALASVKLDGIRGLLLPGDAPRSRSLSWLPNKRLAGLVEGLQARCDRLNVVCDGEWYAHGVEFHDLQSAIMSESGVLPAGLAYHVLDAADLDEWNGVSVTPFAARERLVHAMTGGLSGGLSGESVAPVAQKLVATWGEARAFYADALAGGYEGAMFRDPAGLLFHGRTGRDLWRLKPVETFDAVVLSVGDTRTPTARVRMANGVELTVGGFSAVTGAELAVGRRLEFLGTRYGARRVPRFARFSRWRHPDDV